MKKRVFILLIVLAAFSKTSFAEIIETQSEEGNFLIKAQTEPDHTIVGNTIVTLTVVDVRSRNPVEGVRIEAVPWMTIHGHGSSKKTRVKEKGKGIYAVEDVFFTMAGDWDLLITLRKDAIEDKAIVTFKNVKK